MRESSIESRLRTEAAKRGGLALKFVSPGVDGVPDRLLLMPGGRCAFVELKAPGRTPGKQQMKRIGRLRKLGFRVYVVDDTAMIGGILDEICGT